MALDAADYCLMLLFDELHGCRLPKGFIGVFTSQQLQLPPSHAPPPHLADNNTNTIMCQAPSEELTQVDCRRTVHPKLAGSWLRTHEHAMNPMRG